MIEPLTEEEMLERDEKRMRELNRDKAWSALMLAMDHAATSLRWRLDFKSIQDLETKRRFFRAARARATGTPWPQVIKDHPDLPWHPAAGQLWMDKMMYPDTPVPPDPPLEYA